MSLKTIQVSEIPTINQLHNKITTTSPLPHGLPSPKPAKFVVIGHRGNGMNSPSSTNFMKENSILSFNEAGRYPIQYIEFDVQVTSDDHPVIFHDNSILAQNEPEKLVTDLTLQQFLSYNSKQLLRKTPGGQIVDWMVEKDDTLCTLEEAFLHVDPHLGFNIELKFDDYIVYKDEELIRALQIVLNCVFRYAGSRNILFSTFQPDAARLVRKMQDMYPVFFLTDGGVEIYDDERRNSLEEAVKLCREFGLQGIVSEVRALMREPRMVPEIRGHGLGVMSYGMMNNVAEVVCLQHLMGIDGVIVDRVKEITDAVSGFLSERGDDDEGEERVSRPQFSQTQLDFVLKLIPVLVRN